MARMRARFALAVTLGLIGLALSPTGPAGADAARPGYVTGPRGGAPTGIALDFVRSNPSRFGVSADDVAGLRVTDAYTSDHTGVTHVYLRQRRAGLDVLGSSATISVDDDGSILFVGSRLVSGLDAASGRATLDAPAAAVRAAEQLGLTPTRPIRVVRSTGPEVVLSRGGISLRPIPARLAYQAVPDGAVRLAWNLEIEEVSQQHWWNASVDAETGALLTRIDYVDHDEVDATASALSRPGGNAAALPTSGVRDGASYRVFALPLESPNDGDRTVVEGAADTVASPHGWHDTDGADGPESTATTGNNVDAYLDTTNAGTGTPVTRADGGSDLTFDFAFDPSLPPTANKDAAVTNLFYWNNIIHDVFYGYGFDEESGNFQVNNYGRGGAGNDSVRAEGQDGSGVNNANFGTPADGSQPRMQMYVWTTGLQSDQRIIDGDFDAGVIVHEYGHGISNRLTGGPGTSSCLRNQEQGGEGWSDWLALALTTLEGETGDTPRGMGTYVLNEGDRTEDGIRVTPYSTDMSVNPSTYDDVKRYAVPHGVGYVWATMLWEVYWSLIDEHGFNPDAYGDWTTGGNNLAIQLVMDGMKLQPCSPGFVDARDAIIAADFALTEGRNECLLWHAFAKRGLGWSADQGSPTSRSDGTESFDLPPHVPSPCPDVVATE